MTNAKYPRSRRVMIPAARRDAANAALAADLGPNMFSIPITNNRDPRNITHYACDCGALTEAQYQILKRVSVRAGDVDTDKSMRDMLNDEDVDIITRDENNQPILRPRPAPPAERVR